MAEFLERATILPLTPTRRMLKSEAILQCTNTCVLMSANSMYDFINPGATSNGKSPVPRCELPDVSRSREWMIVKLKSPSSRRYVYEARM